MTLAPGTQLGPYAIVSQLGQGGMGVVYTAHDPRLDRHVAIKLLPPDLTRDDTAKRRFLQEAKAASALDHPNICKAALGGPGRVDSPLPHHTYGDLLGPTACAIMGKLVGLSLLT